MTDPTPPEAAPPKPLLPPRFQRSLFLVSVVYMLVMFGASEWLGNDQPLTLWWRTALPVGWLGAILAHRRHRGDVRTARAQVADAIRRKPGFAVLMGGMAIVVEAMTFMPWDAAQPDLTVFYAASGVVVAAAITTSLLARRKR